MTHPSLPIAAVEPSSGAGHGRDPRHERGYIHDHGDDHDHDHDHDHAHARTHPHAHDHGGRPAAAVRVTPSLIRASLATRLAVAAAAAAVIWAGVAWALAPIAG